jgi:hypothetical protein
MSQVAGQATRGENESAARAVLDQLEHLILGEAITHDRMALFPVFPRTGAPAGGALNYRTLEQAIADGSVSVTERPSASVPELLVKNTGGTLVLILDGEEIIGGLQNRVVNTTFLVGAQMEVVLPVTCVERGRWQRTSAAFRSGESTYYQLRRSKHQQVTASLRASGKPVANQHEVWAEVAERETSTGSRSLTGAMHEIYRTREPDLGAYQTAFPYTAGAIGLIVALNGQMAGGDVFDQAAPAEALWPKLVRSYALDALEGEPGRAVSREEALELLRRLRDARAEVYPSLALGEEVRLEAERAVGSGLVYQGTPVHISLFHTDGGERSARQTRISSTRIRRRLQTGTSAGED